MPRNLLLYRFIIVNSVGAALLVWAGSLGYVRQVFEGDVSRISYVITALFAAGLASTAWRVWSVNAAVNAGQRLPGMIAKNAHIEAVAEWLVTLGLIGNVIGFVLALRGIDTSSIANAESARGVAAHLLEGMGVAFYSTLAGAVFALWTNVNFLMLRTATALHLGVAK